MGMHLLPNAYLMTLYTQFWLELTKDEEDLVHRIVNTYVHILETGRGHTAITNQVEQTILKPIIIGKNLDSHFHYRRRICFHFSVIFP